ncbi:M10 family metallopeptidase C-terminal domain-containing protein [Aquabacterium sp.]|uniref:M10 family metallopeptidase C-terminal domain-containing protein n=1 Tax=Aquabacterium sp. TaxID=1872578 RepID=UPI002C1E5BD5|nr:M10 family metallopeptidase C-terminal domain-containing protein [Aquabacterium sp.]HSW09228.1 M10 family metallopeptidase C-terminal domain-containing protein [Aquabacterium sp.]
MVDYTKTISPSGNNTIDSIIHLYAWESSALTYGFRVQDIDHNGISDFSEGHWASFYQSIFSNISTFANLKFTQTTYENARLNQLMNPGGGGQSSDPAPDVVQTFTEVDIDGSVADASAVVFLGQYSDTWMHEIGHSLGLRHSFETPNQIDDNVNSEADLGTHYLNSTLYTVMSYSPTVWGEDNPWTDGYDPGTVLNANAGSYMPLDIAALQYMYGAHAYNTGNTTYSFGDDKVASKGYTTIWDTGGTDTIAYTGTSRARIDLDAATLQRDIGGGGLLSTSETFTGGFLIANGVVIEKAIGGSNDDILIGNSAANTLTGNGGNDFLNGGNGADRLIGGAGDDYYIVANTGDTVTEASNAGFDQVESTVTFTLGSNVEDLFLRGASAINGTGNSSANYIYGNDVINSLSGRGGNDHLDGGLGVDFLTGGTGRDTFDFSTTLGSGNVDNITDFSAAEDYIGLSFDIFTALRSTGTLASSKFYQGSAAHDSSDRIFYNSSTGNIYYDVDGNGSAAAVLFAHVATGLTLTASNFNVWDV